MTCYYPLMAFYSKEIGKTGKRGITFNRSASFSGAPLRLPCSQCHGCRLDRSLQWGVRCMHEKQLHDTSCFVTLTYDDDHLPEGGTLVPDDHRLFMYRMRKRMGKGIRFYMCGEYGEDTKRPHYHYLFFNRDFSDRKFLKMSKQGDRYDTSASLRELWPHGNNIIGDVTLESCCYVARYICDKITGDMASAHYEVFTADGVLVNRVPEFTRMSRSPGLASEWYEKYGRHAHLSGDFAVLNGKRVRMPRFYDKRFADLDSQSMDVIKLRRRRNAVRHRKNNFVDRLRVREVVALRKAHLFKRNVG